MKISEGEKVLSNKELADKYVENYVQSHKNKSIDYKISYSYYYLLDSIMDKEYSLMDIGIGTGGGTSRYAKVKKISWY